MKNSKIYIVRQKKLDKQQYKNKERVMLRIHFIFSRQIMEHIHLLLHIYIQYLKYQISFQTIIIPYEVEGDRNPNYKRFCFNRKLLFSIQDSTLLIQTCYIYLKMIFLFQFIIYTFVLIIEQQLIMDEENLNSQNPQIGIMRKNC
ncbi:hypothetical protein pb186bvf_009892 [Paramecium bursaria]